MTATPPNEIEQKLKGFYEGGMTLGISKQHTSEDYSIWLGPMDCIATEAELIELSYKIQALLGIQSC